MAKNNSKSSIDYPEEKEGNTKDANKKLKSQIRSLKKTIKQLESQVGTLNRSFNKSCDFIQDKLEKRSLKDILNMIDTYDYKETEHGREQAKIRKNIKKAEEKDDNDIFFITNCPRCNNDITKGFNVMRFNGFKIENCSCGYRNRIEDGNAGSEGS